MGIDLNTVRGLAPEIMLTIIATWLYVGGAFGSGRGRIWWALFALCGYAIAGYNLYRQDGELARLFESFKARPSGPMLVDYLGSWLRWLSLGVGAIFTLIAARTASRRLSSEFFGSLMLAVVGLMLVARANELVFLFLSLELISIPTYVLLFLGRKDRSSAEATAKYFYLSILSSALLLYGFTFLYGLTGTTVLSEIPLRLKALGDANAGLATLGPIALVLVLAGLGFKLAAVPFHFYAPDVYQGTTNANAGLLAVVPKIAGLAAIVRLVVVALPVFSEFVWQIAIVISILTMTIGNICALWQRNVRRLMAYSSIAHAGYLLIGLAVGVAGKTPDGLAAMWFYLLVYAVASAGTFAALTFLGSEDRDVSGLDELAGVAKSHPIIAAAMAVFMFSLMGLPPLAGFWGKLTLFVRALELAQNSPDSPLMTWFILLAVAGAINAAIAAAYYLRVVATMYFKPELAPVDAKGGPGAWLAAAICALGVLVIGFSPRATADRADKAALSAFPSRVAANLDTSHDLAVAPTADQSP